MAVTTRPVPKPDYLSRDFVGLKSSLLQYAALSFPDWQPASEGDFGMVLVEMFAYFGDILSYYTDRAQFENYLGTATQRDSILGIAYLLGYLPNSGAPATGTVELVTDLGRPDTLVPGGSKILTGRIAAIDGPVTFETDDDATVPANGATSAVVNVTEGTTENYVKVGESGGLPAQTFLLAHTGVYRDTIRVFVEDTLGSVTFPFGANTIVAREWLLVDHLLDADSTGAVFETQYVDDGVMVNFGDDINGAIPGTGLQIFATYRHGVGSNGNVTAGQVKLIDDRTLAGVHVKKDTNDVYLSSTMIGGTDPESIDSIRYNAPRAYRTQNRVVTEPDFIDLALGVEGVGKANVLVGTFTSVTVYVTGPDGGIPSDTLLDLVQSKFEGKTLTGVTVTVSPPTFVQINFGASLDRITVELYPQYSRKTALAAIKRDIRTFLSSMAFGDKLSVSDIYRVIKNVEGVRYADVSVMARADSAQTGTTRITPREWEVFTMGSTFFTMTGGVA